MVLGRDQVVGVLGFYNAALFTGAICLIIFGLTFLAAAIYNA